jgi:hypothetical protein
MYGYTMYGCTIYGCSDVRMYDVRCTDNSRISKKLKSGAYGGRRPVEKPEVNGRCSLM